MALISKLQGGGGQSRGGKDTALDIGLGDPAAPIEDGAKAAVRGALQDAYFFTSIEDFLPGVGDLSLTHDDAKGFYDYVLQFNTPNGWYRDGSVGQWIYEETYDNYLDDYGFDSAKVVYHSGHGGMSTAGVFSIPLGNTWGGDSWTSSDQMRLGNEYARYVFWSTCESLRVKGGHTPIRTWSVANLGLRMIFGYETVSVDSGDYGKFFFEEWNKNNSSFSTAFLNASWRISTHQEPSVVACGATQAEASGRVLNERMFYGGQANTSWWWWRWYDATRMRAGNLRVPDRIGSARLASPLVTIRALGDRFDIPLPSDVADTRALLKGSTLEGGSGRRLAVGPDGSVTVTLAEPSESANQLSVEEAIRAATRAVDEYQLAEEVDLIVDHTRFDRHAGASQDEQIDESVRETTVFFTQVIDGLPVIAPNAGFVQVRVDNDGTVTAIADNTRRIIDIRDHPSAPPEPEASRRDSSPRTATGGNPLAESEVTQPGERGIVDVLLEDALQSRLRRIAASGRVSTAARVVPESSEIGYSFRDDDAVLVARQEVELDFGYGLAKRYILEAPVQA